MKHPVAALLAFVAGSAVLVLGSAPSKEKSAAPPKEEAARAQQTPLLRAANAFLATLDAEQRGKARLAFDSDERLNWHFVPRERSGIPFKALNEAQRKAALDLLREGLSAQGYRKVEAIRALEPILREREGGNPSRDPELFYFTLFGTPSATGPWGCRYEGHHISLNWTVVDGKVIGDSPQFLGANPARVASGPLRGTRVLEAEEDLARALVKSLDEQQKKEAVLGATAPRDILTGARRRAAIEDSRGIAHRRLHREQKGLLLALIRVYADAMPRAVAQRRLERIRGAGLDEVKFAWMGALEPGQGHYYRVLGPTFLIEYDNTQNGANHIHTVWRDFHGDFGADLLARHYKAHAHDHNHGHSHGPAPTVRAAATR